MQPLTFKGQVALVTGAGRGMGRSHALYLARRGAKVVVNDNGSTADGSGCEISPAEEVVREIQALGGEAVADTNSVATESGAKSIVQSAINTWGRIDIVINNAGVVEFVPFAEMTYEQFRRLIQVHLDGAWLVTRAAWPHMTHQQYGRVIFITSQAALTGMPSLTHYGAAKWAVVGLARQLSLETGDLDIKVNALGVIAYTRLAQPFFDPKARERSKTSMASNSEGWWQRNMRADQISPVAAWLSHKDCDVNGEIVETGAGHTFHQFFTSTDGYTNVTATAEDIVENKSLIFDQTRTTHVFRHLKDMGAWRVQRALAAGAEPLE
ncbi:SDR family NAD(P)-dependent oxidoreductase [Bradyrhizobium betae]|uniref:Ketoreductase domain-containing protein n=1 Tax=Bradyrhizobium betae TaxID=244734 RepID=A0A4Q1VNT0_9BRAD|nr:SDR family NAD(P)-dependent oxidoreductase [Bradyrhizobium betae]RXT54248.1 hypothetical protein B5V03_02065 [Bradyrhizobium betae]